MKFHRHHKAEPHVPFIALADIAWQIIIFFLVASTFARNESLKVDLPSSASGAGGQYENNITVQAGETLLMLDASPIELTQLQPRIKDMLAGKTTDQGKVVVVIARDDLSFQRSSEVLYAIQKAGGVPLFSDDGSSGGNSGGGSSSGSSGEGGRP
jgi:biopolymer transport protein ExbD